MTDNPFDTPKGEKIPSLSFTITDPVTGVMTPMAVGTRLGGKIIKSPELVQQTKFKTNEPLFWKKKGDGWEKVTEDTGSPAMTVVTQLETSEGVRSLWAPKSNKECSLCRAVADAIKVAGATSAEVGGELWVTLTKIVPNPNGGQPSKEYSAVYTPPNQFQVESPSAATGTVPAPPAPPAPPVPAPPAPSAAATTPEGYTLAGLIANGWTQEQALSVYPMLGGAPAAPVPPAPPAPPSAAAAAPANGMAMLATMPDEDLALLKMRRLPDGSIVNA